VVFKLVSSPFVVVTYRKVYIVVLVLDSMAKVYNRDGKLATGTQVAQEIKSRYSSEQIKQMAKNYRTYWSIFNRIMRKTSNEFVANSVAVKTCGFSPDVTHSELFFVDKYLARGCYGGIKEEENAFILDDEKKLIRSFTVLDDLNVTRFNDFHSIEDRETIDCMAGQDAWVCNH